MSMLLHDGEQAELLEPLSVETLTYIGSTGGEDDSPTYTSTNYIVNGDSLTAAIGKIDAALGAMVPVGSYLAFDDFNATLPFPDANYWQICDGTVIADLASPINGQPVKDASGRYWVGFGTDGGADIGGAGAMALAGNVAHQISIQHNHGALGVTASVAGGTGATGTTSNDHTHTGPSHTHDSGTLYAQGGRGQTDSSRFVYLSASTTGSSSVMIDGNSSGNSTEGYLDGIDVTGSTDTDGTGATSGQSTGHTHTGPSHTHDINHTHANNLSTTQSIQPRSVQVRMFLKYK